MTQNDELLRTTTSLCPECLQNIPAKIIWEKSTNRIMMKKTCPEHGDFEDRISGDPEEYIWSYGYAKRKNSISSTKPENLTIPNIKGCPYNCGLCDRHISAPCICIIDLTNRCNLRCPVCFANSAATGYIYEPTFEEIVQIMKHFRAMKPVPAIMCQLSGGEPTLRKDLTKIIRKAHELGFIHVMLTTNGVKLAKSKEYCREIMEAGTDAVYLSFDGIEPETWVKMRGVDLSKIKMRVLDNLREIGYKGVALVPTIVNGVNDHEIGNILDVAKEYSDIVSAVVFQPVSLTGRISIEDLNQMRYTTSDLKEAINEYTDGMISKFYPIATMSKLTRLMPWFDKEDEFAMTTHDDCGFATLGILDEKKDKWLSIETFFDVEGVLKFTNETYDMVMRREIPKPTKLLNLDTTVSKLPRIFREFANFTDEMADLTYRSAMKAYYMAGVAKYFKGDLNFVLKHRKTFFKFLKMAFRPGLDSTKDFMFSGNIMISSMHFQDSYNFDLERVQRCIVHYGVIDPENPANVLEIPFCSMNTYHRPDLEKKLAKRKEPRTVDQIDAEVEQLISEFSKQ
ncbi:MAG: radical SAM protein [Promethearchaeota archaeon]